MPVSGVSQRCDGGNGANEHHCTRDAVCALVRRFGSQRAAARFLGVSPATINDIIRQRGHLSRERENQIRASLALPPLPPTVTIPACRDCGGAHYGDCGGRTVRLTPVRGKREPVDLWGYNVEKLAMMIRERVTV